MTKSVSIIQINDTHANLFEHGDVRYSHSGFTVEKVGGYARIMTKINEYKARYTEEVLIFDNGDTLHGTYEAIETKGEVMVPYLKMLGVDAMTFHWDAAYTIPHLKSFEQKLGYPILAANVYDEDTNDLIFPATAIFEVYDLTVGVIGLASNIIRSNMPEPVSYTHLDVYKRQLCDLSSLTDRDEDEERAEETIINQLSTVDEREEKPVSYTHLDVYKRQI